MCPPLGLVYTPTRRDTPFYKTLKDYSNNSLDKQIILWYINPGSLLEYRKSDSYFFFISSAINEVRVLRRQHNRQPGGGGVPVKISPRKGDGTCSLL